MSGHVALVCLCVLFVWSVSSTVLREDGHQSSAKMEGQTWTKIVEKHSRAQLDARKEVVEEIRRVFSDQLTTCNSRLYEAQQKITITTVTSLSHQKEAESLRAENLQLKQKFEESAQNLKIKSDHLERLEKTKAQCDLEVTALTGDVAKLRGKEEELSGKLANKASDLQQEMLQQVLNYTKTIMQSASTKQEQDFIKLVSNIKETVERSTSDSKSLIIQNTNDIKQEISEVIKQEISEVIKKSDNILVEIISSKTEIENGFVKMTNETNSRYTALQSKHGEMFEVIKSTEKKVATGTVWLGDNIYYFSDKVKRTWYAARNFCISKGLTLASIESDEENQRVFNHKQKLGMSDTWLGGSDEAREGTWLWTGTGATLTYTNWRYGQPAGGSGENCMEMRSDGEWQDFSCTTAQPFICEQQG